MMKSNHNDRLELGDQLSEKTLSGLKNILFVDDERNILSALHRLFKRHGFTTFMASDGETGIEILRENSIDVVISDMQMPGMKGDQFLAEAVKINKDAIRILLTGHADLGSTVNAINEGSIYRYISKPWDDDAIVELVEEALRSRQLEQEKQQNASLAEQKNLELEELNNHLEKTIDARTKDIEMAVGKFRLANRKLNKTYLDTIKAFMSLINTRDGLSYRYASKVAELSKKMAQALKLNESDIQDIFAASMLHELGKVSLPCHLLNRPTSTYELSEQAQYHGHPTVGHDVLACVDGLKKAAIIIRSHEEYYNGSGFPIGLSTHDIPLGARILSIAKDFYAYQGTKHLSIPQSATASLKRIQAQSGNLYDPTLTKVLSDIVTPQLSDSEEPTEIVLSARHLLSGMTLARDLHSHERLLLPKGRQLTEGLINRLLAFEKNNETYFEIHVLDDETSKISE